ncbi:diguanylate cyclase [Salinimonas chungwhensis]|uniref:diguanylate cyclase n=1 Tax=Salinimonas chungwhensis TaxID=265425 RepID=UPI000379E452|nr:diguanylate cyclase [Salinimonas chungwhensis]
MLLRQNAEQTIADCTVLIVDDQPTSRLIMTSLLEDITHSHAVTGANEALDFCLAQLPDLVVSDVSMPEMSGRELCQALRSNAKTAGIPVMFVTSSDSDEEQEKCWESGGVDFVTKPINATTFRNRVKSQLSHKLKADLLEQLIYTDRLTGAFNRHYLDERLPFIVKECDREVKPLAIAIFDIDFFKRFNDEYGHLAGDKCLCRLAKAINGAMLRPMDQLVRVGGEEFLILMPNTTQQGAVVVCQRILETVRQLHIPHIKSDVGEVTVSMGLSMYEPGESKDPFEVINEADKYLYSAKNSGRNRLVYE